MSSLATFTRGLLQVLPRGVKDGVRRVTPHGFFVLVERAASGQPLWGQNAQTHLSCAVVRGLERRMWHGFSAPAKDELEQWQVNGQAPQQRAEAAMALARFHAARSEHAEALACLETVRAESTHLRSHRRVGLIELYALAGLESWAKLTDAISDASERWPDDMSVAMACASMRLVVAGGDPVRRSAATQAWLDDFNRVLSDAGMVGLKRRDESRPLALDNLTAAEPMPKPVDMAAKVSVLMAVYNRRDALECAVRSVLAQSWRNLELVLVDDASNDDSWPLIQRLAAEDERIVAIQQPANGGAYIARNTALERATGQFVTVNDADDWAHPQKIQKQVEALLAPDAPLANVSALMRVDACMLAQPRFDNPQVPIIHKNFSSLMLPRETVVAMGGWDRVRISGDSEFIGRLKTIHGASAVAELCPEVPVALALLEKNNLTASSSRSLWTFRFGARREYARQFKEWHRSAQDLRMRRTSDRCPFPVPGLCFEQKVTERAFDLVVVSDFQNADMLKTLVDRGQSLAILPWADFGVDFDRAVDDDVTRYCREQGIPTLVHGEAVRCKQLLVGRPSVMMHRLDRVPVIEADEIRLLEDSVDNCDQECVEDNVQWAFGKQGQWMSLHMHKSTV